MADFHLNVTMTMPNMLNKSRRTRNFTLMVIGILALCQHVADARVGVCYGTQSSKLLPFKDVISLCNTYNIQGMRLYKPNIKFLESLRGSRISIMLGLPNEDIPRIAKNTSFATLWVKKYVRNFYNVEIKYVVIGNDISPSNNVTSKYAPFVFLAITNMHGALLGSWFGSRTVMVTTAISSNTLAPWIHPTDSRFLPQFKTYIGPIVNFLIGIKSPLLVNVNMYSRYASDPKNATLDFTLFKYNVPDPRAAVKNYRNMFDATLDAMYFAVEDVNNEVSKLSIVVSEIGWPTAGGTGANIENAKEFNTNLMMHVAARISSDLRWSNKHIESYISSMFDENLRSPKYAKHMGVFNQNKKAKYPIIFHS